MGVLVVRAIGAMLLVSGSVSMLFGMLLLLGKVTFK